MEQLVPVLSTTSSSGSGVRSSGKSIWTSRYPFHQAKVFHRSYQRLFLFWTVHGPFSLFLRQEKEKMGGGNGPAAGSG
ncbi:MAG: hypothetical protein HFF87_12115 [Oscillibacter sp.]|nr:hypothetical protein [Oscillibacter sp.]